MMTFRQLRGLVLPPATWPPAGTATKTTAATITTYHGTPRWVEAHFAFATERRLLALTPVLSGRRPVVKGHFEDTVKGQADESSGPAEPSHPHQKAEDMTAPEIDLPLDGSLQMGFRQRPSWHADAVRGAVHPIIPGTTHEGSLSDLQHS
jgi:hypothetical protein